MPVFLALRAAVTLPPDWVPMAASRALRVVRPSRLMPEVAPSRVVILNSLLLAVLEAPNPRSVAAEPVAVNEKLVVPATALRVRRLLAKLTDILPLSAGMALI